MDTTWCQSQVERTTRASTQSTQMEEASLRTGPRTQACEGNYRLQRLQREVRGNFALCKTIPSDHEIGALFSFTWQAFWRKIRGEVDAKNLNAVFVLRNRKGPRQIPTTLFEISSPTLETLKWVPHMGAPTWLVSPLKLKRPFLFPSNARTDSGFDILSELWATQGCHEQECNQKKARSRKRETTQSAVPFGLWGDITQDRT